MQAAAARKRSAGHRLPEVGSGASSGVSREPRNATVQYPGGLRARWRWAGSGQGSEVFALSETGGALLEHGPAVGDRFADLCRAELRLDGPRGAWTARFASMIYDEPRALLWDTANLFVVGYGFHTYGLEPGSGEQRWFHRSASPIVTLLGSSRLAHVVVQAEIETFAIEGDGTVAWRVAHSDVVTAAELVGGTIVLTSFTGQLSSIDPASGRPSG